MQLIPKEIILSHLQRSEGAEEVSLPIDFFRDLLYQAMPQQRTWVGLTEEDFVLVNQLCTSPIQAAEFVDHLLKEKNA